MMRISIMFVVSSGNLYGTGIFGGSSACNLGCGTIFKLASPSGGHGWTGSVLFDLGNRGQDPNSSLVEYHNSWLFGNTTYLGAHDVGSIFTPFPEQWYGGGAFLCPQP